MSDFPEIFGAPELAAGTPDRPRVTLALFAYNQQRYVRAAVEGALAQDYDGPLEIILSDDGSPDDTFKVMQEVAFGYAGPHHVRLNRNEANLGISAHVNRVLAMARGEIIVMAAGDDISLPSRVTDTVAAFARHPEAMAVSFTDIRIDEADCVLGAPAPDASERTIDLDTFLAAGPRAQSKLGLSGASRAFRSEIYQTFGDLLSDCPAEDSPYLLRILYLGMLIVLPHPGIHYRAHATQMSSEMGIAKQNGAKYQSQMESDIEIACKLKIIPRLQKKRAMKFANELRIFRNIQRFKYMNLSPNLELVFDILLSKRCGAREKIGIVLRYVKNSAVS